MSDFLTVTQMTPQLLILANHLLPQSTLNTDQTASYVDRKLLGGTGGAPRGRHLLGDVLHGDGGRDDVPGELDQDVTLGTWEGPALSGVHIRLQGQQNLSLTWLHKSAPTNWPADPHLPRILLMPVIGALPGWDQTGNLRHP